MTRPGFAPRLDRKIEFSPRAPAEARAAVGDLAADPDLRDSIDVGLIADVQLLVSELVTNSVRHSGSEDPISLRAWLRASGGLRVEVADGGFGFEPGFGRADGESESGRGLLILEALTDRWGMTRDARARIWFEMAPRPQSAGRARTAS